jgi:hypothetical protein
VLVRRQLLEEWGAVQTERGRIQEQIAVVECALVLEQHVVHLPELPLCAGRRRLLGVGMDHGERKVPEHEAQLTAGPV